MKQFQIPDDWNQEEDGYVSVLFCIPNSRKWRGLIVGLIDSLAFGWSWDKQTGNIKDTQAIGREIFESMLMGCLEPFFGNLIITQRLLIAAITGQTINLADPLPSGEVDFSSVGLSPKFEGANGNIALAVEALATELQALQTTISESSGAGDLEDDLANVWNALTAIANVLGIEVPAPPEPL